MADFHFQKKNQPLGLVEDRKKRPEKVCLSFQRLDGKLRSEAIVNNMIRVSKKIGRELKDLFSLANDKIFTINTTLEFGMGSARV
jgi:hypothetical protein